MQLEVLKSSPTRDLYWACRAVLKSTEGFCCRQKLTFLSVLVLMVSFESKGARTLGVILQLHDPGTCSSFKIIFHKYNAAQSGNPIVGTWSTYQITTCTHSTEREPIVGTWRTSQITTWTGSTNCAIYMSLGHVSILLTHYGAWRRYRISEGLFESSVSLFWLVVLNNLNAVVYHEG